MASWAYAVTTTPRRRDDLLPRTLASLRAAGFSHPRLVIDGCPPSEAARYREQFGLEVMSHCPLLRAFGAWRSALEDLFKRWPREYLERTTTEPKVYWNLYSSPSACEACPPGHTGWYPSQQNGRGALGLVFGNEAAELLMLSPHMVRKLKDPVKGWRSIDGAVIESMKAAGYKELVHNPSLVQHLGVVSTVDKRKTARAHDPNFPEFRWDERGRSPTFRGEQFNLLTLLQ
jgi:hypothetical protein